MFYYNIKAARNRAAFRMDYRACLVRQNPAFPVLKSNERTALNFRLLNYLSAFNAGGMWPFRIKKESAISSIIVFTYV